MKEKGKKMSQNSPEERAKESSTEKGWKPTVVHDQRSLDIGKSGQFAPGGYYNQRGVTAPRRIDLDEYTAMRPRDNEEEKE